MDSVSSENVGESVIGGERVLGSGVEAFVEATKLCNTPLSGGDWEFDASSVVSGSSGDGPSQDDDGETSASDCSESDMTEKEEVEKKLGKLDGKGYMAEIQHLAARVMQRRARMAVAYSKVAKGLDLERLTKEWFERQERHIGTLLSRIASVRYRAEAANVVIDLTTSNKLISLVDELARMPLVAENKEVVRAISPVTPSVKIADPPVSIPPVTLCNPSVEPKLQKSQKPASVNEKRKAFSLMPSLSHEHMTEAEGCYMPFRRFADYAVKTINSDGSNPQRVNSNPHGCDAALRKGDLIMTFGSLCANHKGVLFIEDNQLRAWDTVRHWYSACYDDPLFNIGSICTSRVSTDKDSCEKWMWHDSKGATVHCRPSDLSEWVIVAMDVYYDISQPGASTAPLAPESIIKVMEDLDVKKAVLLNHLHAPGMGRQGFHGVFWADDEWVWYKPHCGAETIDHPIVGWLRSSGSVGGYTYTPRSKRINFVEMVFVKTDKPPISVTVEPVLNARYEDGSYVWQRKCSTQVRMFRGSRAATLAATTQQMAAQNESDPTYVYFKKIVPEDVFEYVEMKSSVVDAKYATAFMKLASEKAGAVQNLFNRIKNLERIDEYEYPKLLMIASALLPALIHILVRIFSPFNPCTSWSPFDMYTCYSGGGSYALFSWGLSTLLSGCWLFATYGILSFSPGYDLTSPGWILAESLLLAFIGYPVFVLLLLSHFLWDNRTALWHKNYLEIDVGSLICQAFVFAYTVWFPLIGGAAHWAYNVHCNLDPTWKSANILQEFVELLYEGGSIDNVVEALSRRPSFRSLFTKSLTPLSIVRTPEHVSLHVRLLPVQRVRAITNAAVLSSPGSRRDDYNVGVRGMGCGLETTFSGSGKDMEKIIELFTGTEEPDVARVQDVYWFGGLIPTDRFALSPANTTHNLFSVMYNRVMSKPKFLGNHPDPDVFLDFGSLTNGSMNLFYVSRGDMISHMFEALTPKAAKRIQKAFDQDVKLLEGCADDILKFARRIKIIIKCDEVLFRNPLKPRAIFCVDPRVHAVIAPEYCWMLKLIKDFQGEHDYFEFWLPHISYRFRVGFGCYKNDSQLSDWQTYIDLSPPNTIWVLVAGDDSRLDVVHTTTAVFCFDVSGFDHSNGPYHHLQRNNSYRSLMLSEDTITALNATKSATLVANFRNGAQLTLGPKLVGSYNGAQMRAAQQPSGCIDTTGGNSIGNANVFYGIFNSMSSTDVASLGPDSNAFLIRKFAENGYEVKGGYTTSPDFLKGMWYGCDPVADDHRTKMWGPLPSRLLKFFKSRINPIGESGALRAIQANASSLRPFVLPQPLRSFVDRLSSTDGPTPSYKTEAVGLGSTRVVSDTSFWFSRYSITDWDVELLTDFLDKWEPGTYWFSHVADKLLAADYA